MLYYFTDILSNKIDFYFFIFLTFWAISVALNLLIHIKLYGNSMKINRFKFTKRAKGSNFGSTQLNEIYVGRLARSSVYLLCLVICFFHSLVWNVTREKNNKKALEINVIYILQFAYSAHATIQFPFLFLFFVFCSFLSSKT